MAKDFKLFPIVKPGPWTDGGTNMTIQEGELNIFIAREESYFWTDFASNNPPTFLNQSRSVTDRPESGPDTSIFSPFINRWRYLMKFRVFVLFCSFIDLFRWKYFFTATNLYQYLKIALTFIEIFISNRLPPICKASYSPKHRRAKSVATCKSPFENRICARL